MLDQDVLLVFIVDYVFIGEDFVFLFEFDCIQESWCVDDLILDQGEWQIDIKYVDWFSVVCECVDLLQICIKDLCLVGWLIEVVIQVEGFCGLVVGYWVVVGLCDQYWDEVYLQVFDDDQEECIGNLSWLFSNFLQWLCNVLIVLVLQGCFMFIDFEVVYVCVSNGGDYYDDCFGLEQLEVVCCDIQYEFYWQLLEILFECVDVLVMLQVVVDNWFGLDGFSFSVVCEQIEYIQCMVMWFVCDVGVLFDGEVVDVLDVEDVFIVQFGFGDVVVLLVCSFGGVFIMCKEVLQ